MDRQERCTAQIDDLHLFQERIDTMPPTSNPSILRAMDICRIFDRSPDLLAERRYSLPTLDDDSDTVERQQPYGSRSRKPFRFLE